MSFNTTEESPSDTDQSSSASQNRSAGFAGSITSRSDRADNPSVIKSAKSDNPAAFCREAAGLVEGDRNATYGDALAQHNRCATLWRAYLKAKYGLDVPITAEDACHMMVDLKRSRAMAGPYCRDNYIDGVGYMALAGYCASKA